MVNNDTRPPLHRLADIADRIDELRTHAETVEDLDWLDALRAKIGETQLRIAQADADAAETASMARQFGPRIRATLDDYTP